MKIVYILEVLSFVTYDKMHFFCVFFTLAFVSFTIKILLSGEHLSKNYLVSPFCSFPGSNQRTVRRYI